MPSEENLLVLKMLQDGTITADQASELLRELTASEERAVADTGTVVLPLPSALSDAPDGMDAPEMPGATVPTPPNLEPENDAFARARARIAAARERVAGVQEKLTAAEERIEAAATKETPGRWEQVADALRDLPATRSVTEALRGIDPNRIAANARRQARRVARGVRSSLGDLNLDINLNLGDAMHGEPTFSTPRELTAAIPAGGTLRVRNTLGGIEAQGADVPEARIAGVLKIWAVDAPTAEKLAGEIELIVEQGTDGPTISVRHPEKIRRTVLDLKVFVPQTGTRLSLMSLAGDVSARGLSSGAAVVLATQSGDAKVAEVTGDAAIETASGDVTIEGLTGNVSASTSSGDIAAIRLTGQSFRGSTQSGDISLADATVNIVAVETVSGDAVVRKVEGRTLRVRAVSGDAVTDDSHFSEEMHLDTVSGNLSALPGSPLLGGTIRLETISGDAHLRLPAEVGGSLDASTKSGQVGARFLDAEGVEKIVKVTGMARLSEAIGTGSGVRITMSTISGDIKVTQNSPVVEIS